MREARRLTPVVRRMTGIETALLCKVQHCESDVAVFHPLRDKISMKNVLIIGAGLQSTRIRFAFDHRRRQWYCSSNQTERSGTEREDH
jgi:hypothetical protein